MYATNFTYDGTTLASLGCVLCQFDNGSERAVGSEITFDTVAVNKGNKYALADYKYENCLSTTLYICKNPCTHSEQDDLIISPSEMSTLSRWLNKKTFKPMIFDATDWTDIIFEASFNVSAVYVGADIYGLELSMKTNRPYAIKAEVTQTLSFTAGNLTKQFNDTSDEIGFIYPNSVEVTCGSAGNLSLTNAIENRTTTVKNCTANEKITFTYPSISSTVAAHDLADDFNYIFLRVANTASSRVNAITASMPCTVVLKYNPVIKVGL